MVEQGARRERAGSLAELAAGLRRLSTLVPREHRQLVRGQVRRVAGREVPAHIGRRRSIRRESGAHDRLGDYCEGNRGMVMIVKWKHPADHDPPSGA